MVTQTKAREHIARAILADSRMPSELDVILQEADGEGQDAAKTLPLLLVEFSQSSRPEYKNTEFVGYEYNDDGEQTSRIFERDWEATAHIELWTADGSAHNIDELADTLVSVLYGYETGTTDDLFFDENNNTVEDLWHFKLQEGFRADELTQTPSVRRWRQVAEVHGSQMYQSEAQPPIRDVTIESDQ